MTGSVLSVNTEFTTEDTSCQYSAVSEETLTQTHMDRKEEERRQFDKKTKLCPHQSGC